MVNGEVCDILAIDTLGGLVIIELKNGEDRYVVQQLTRYYANLLEKKPLEAHIKYEKPVRLIAVTPSFHKHNWIDKQFNKLDIEFFTFEINERDRTRCFGLRSLGSSAFSEIEVPELIKADKSKKSEGSRDEEVHKILDYYVRIRCGHKLGLPNLTVEEIAGLKYSGGITKGKIFKIITDETTEKGNSKLVSVRVPARITVIDFIHWVNKSVPTARGIITPNGRKTTFW